MRQYQVGEHVVYRGKSYTFPGEVCMRDETGVVVKAFGDIEGNYTGMKHIYADAVLEPYTFGDSSEVHGAPLVIYPDDDPVMKMRHWVARYGDRATAKTQRGLMMAKALLAQLDAGLEAWEEKEAMAKRAETLCPVCDNEAYTRGKRCNTCGYTSEKVLTPREEWLASRGEGTK